MKNITIKIKTPEGKVKISVPPDEPEFLTWKELAFVFFEGLKKLGYSIDDRVMEQINKC